MADELAVDVDEAARRLGISPASVWAEISGQRLRSFRFGRRRLVSVQALAEWVQTRELTHGSGPGVRPTRRVNKASSADVVPFPELEAVR